MCNSFIPFPESEENHTQSAFFCIPSFVLTGRCLCLRFSLFFLITCVFSAFYPTEMKILADGWGLANIVTAIKDTSHSWAWRCCLLVWWAGGKWPHEAAIWDDFSRSCPASYSGNGVNFSSKVLSAAQPGIYPQKIVKHCKLHVLINVKNIRSIRPFLYLFKKFPVSPG